MAVLMEIEIPATAEQYDAIDKALDIGSNPPEGFIAHSAQDAGGSMRVVDIWESADAFGAFAQSRLGAAIAEVMGDDAPENPAPKFTELHNAYCA
jgi:heme-degrading monooxygenase HmoA